MYVCNTLSLCNYISHLSAMVIPQYLLFYLIIRHPALSLTYTPHVTFDVSHEGYTCIRIFHTLYVMWHERNMLRIFPITRVWCMHEGDIWIKIFLPVEFDAWHEGNMWIKIFHTKQVIFHAWHELYYKGLKVYLLVVICLDKMTWWCKCTNSQATRFILLFQSMSLLMYSFVWDILLVMWHVTSALLRLNLNGSPLFVVIIPLLLHAFVFKDNFDLIWTHVYKDYIDLCLAHCFSWITLLPDIFVYFVGWCTSPKCDNRILFFHMV